MRIPARPRLSEVCRLGTASTPGLATNLSTSIRRWRKTSAATVDAAAQERSAGSVCWGGNAKGTLRLHLCEPAVVQHPEGHGHEVLRAYGLDLGSGRDATALCSRDTVTSTTRHTGSRLSLRIENYEQSPYHAFPLRRVKTGLAR